MTVLVSKTDYMYQDLRDQIAEGLFAEESCLPTEHMLMAKYGVSRTIVRLSLRRLEEDGLIYRRKGSGTYIKKNARKKINTVNSKATLQVFFVLFAGQYTNPIFLGIMKSFEDNCPHDINMRVCYDNVPQLEHYFKRGADLVFIEGGMLNDYPVIPDEYKNRVILLNKINGQYNHICTDNFLGGEMMIRCLIECGHKNIGLLHYGLNPEQEFYHRLKGIYSELKKNDLEPFAEIELSLHNYERLTPHGGAARLLARIPELTAIVTVSDVLALAVYNTAEQIGISIYDDVSVISLDDLPASRYFYPRLTTIRQPVEEIGRKLVEISRKYASGTTLCCSAKIPPRLIMRNSVKEIK